MAIASGVAADSQRMTHLVNDQVNQLAVASSEISQVARVIQTIAKQTNVRALNGTIEAARAGDDGKGFPVVANEVKHLALETSRATTNVEAKGVGNRFASA